ncbi:MAG: outer membrane beta-barrel protein [Planctomycetota bacterium]
MRFPSFLSTVALLAASCATTPDPEYTEWDPLSVTVQWGRTDVETGLVTNPGGGQSLSEAPGDLTSLGVLVRVPHRSLPFEGGIELGASYSYGSDAGAVEFDPGQGPVRADRTLRNLDLLVGAYAAKPIADIFRLHASLGLVLTAGRVDLDFDRPVDGSTGLRESGGGGGFYVGMGLDVTVAEGIDIGVFARYLDTRIDLNDEDEEFPNYEQRLDDIRVDSMQVGFAATYRF